MDYYQIPVGTPDRALRTVPEKFAEVRVSSIPGAGLGVYHVTPGWGNTRGNPFPLTPPESKFSGEALLMHGGCGNRVTSGMMTQLNYVFRF